jgi:hypothetical protein
LLQIVTVVANDVAIISNESLIVSNGDKSSRIGGGTFALIIVFVFVLFVFTVVGVCNRTFCFCFNDCFGVVFGRRMRGEGGREHKKHVTSRLLFPLVYVTEAQLLLEKYDAEDAIARECDVGDFYADFRSRRFPKEKRHTSDVQKTLDAMTIETKTLEVGAAETALLAEKKKKAFRLENDPGTKKRARKAKKKKKTKMVAKSPPEREKEFSDVICLSDEEDLTDEEIIFVGSKEGKGRNQQQRRNEEEDDEVIICGERGGGKGKRQKQERREEGRNRGRKSVNEEEVIVVGEKESTQIRQARELLERHNRSNTNKKRKSSEGGSDANASPTGTRLSARKKKKATSSSPTKGPRNEPSTTPEPKGPQPKKTPKCVICLDEIEKPTATKCGHVYCDQCIRELIRAQKTKSRCPQCRKKVGLSGLTKLILDD